MGSIKDFEDDHDGVPENKEFKKNKKGIFLNCAQQGGSLVT
jgi:hypothetical protein